MEVDKENQPMGHVSRSQSQDLDSFKAEVIQRIIQEIQKDLLRKRSVRKKLLIQLKVYLARVSSLIEEDVTLQCLIIKYIGEWEQLIIETTRLCLSLSHPTSEIHEVRSDFYDIGIYMETVIIAAYTWCKNNGKVFGHYVIDLLDSLLEFTGENPSEWLYTVMISPLVLHIVNSFLYPEHKLMREEWSKRITPLMKKMTKAVVHCGDFCCQYYLMTVISGWIQWSPTSRAIPLINECFSQVPPEARRDILQSDDNTMRIRYFINSLNTCTRGPKTVIPISLRYIFVGDNELKAPEHVTRPDVDFWADFSLTSGRMHVFYSFPNVTPFQALNIWRDQVDSVCLNWVVNDGCDENHEDSESEWSAKDTQSSTVAFKRDDMIFFFHIELNRDFGALTTDVPSLIGKGYRSVYLVFQNGELAQRVLAEMGYSVHKCGTKNCKRPKELRRQLNAQNRLSYSESWCPNSVVLGLDKTQTPSAYSGTNATTKSGSTSASTCTSVSGVNTSFALSTPGRSFITNTSLNTPIRPGEKTPSCGTPPSPSCSSLIQEHALSFAHSTPGRSFITNTTLNTPICPGEKTPQCGSLPLPTPSFSSLIQEQLLPYDQSTPGKSFITNFSPNSAPGQGEKTPSFSFTPDPISERLQLAASQLARVPTTPGVVHLNTTTSVTDFSMDLESDLELSPVLRRDSVRQCVTEELPPVDVSLPLLASLSIGEKMVKKRLFDGKTPCSAKEEKPQLHEKSEDPGRHKSVVSGLDKTQTPSVYSGTNASAKSDITSVSVCTSALSTPGRSFITNTSPITSISPGEDTPPCGSPPSPSISSLVREQALPYAHSTPGKSFIANFSPNSSISVSPDVDTPSCRSPPSPLISSLKQKKALPYAQSPPRKSFIANCSPNSSISVCPDVETPSCGSPPSSSSSSLIQEQALPYAHSTPAKPFIANFSPNSSFSSCPGKKTPPCGSPPSPSFPSRMQEQALPYTHSTPEKTFTANFSPNSTLEAPIFSSTPDSTSERLQLAASQLARVSTTPIRVNLTDGTTSVNNLSIEVDSDLELSPVLRRDSVRQYVTNELPPVDVSLHLQTPLSQTKSREGISKSRESITKSRESITKSRESTTKSRESIAKPRESISKSRESIAKSRESITKSRESISKSRESKAKKRLFDGKTPCYANAYREEQRQLQEKSLDPGYDVYDPWCSSQMEYYRKMLFPKAKTYRGVKKSKVEHSITARKRNNLRQEQKLFLEMEELANERKRKRASTISNISLRVDEEHSDSTRSRPNKKSSNVPKQSTSKTTRNRASLFSRSTSRP